MRTVTQARGQPPTGVGEPNGWAVVLRSELRDGTLKMVHTILSRAPLAVRMAMETIRRGQNMSQQEGAQIEVDMFGLASTTADMKEGMAAFLEKRPAKFTGR